MRHKPSTLLGRGLPRTTVNRLGCKGHCQRSKQGRQRGRIIVTWLHGKHVPTVPKKLARIAAVEPTALLCCDGYDGMFGVVRSVVQFGSAFVSGLPSVSAARI